MHYKTERMKNFYLLLLGFLALTSCTKYNISGSSDVADVDGRMLYLKAISSDALENIDSCDIVHGKFKFSGPLDSVRVVMLYMDQMAVLPVVLEEGNITINVNGQQQDCKGTPLNDSLSSFNKRYNQLLATLENLSHEQNQAIMNGEDMEQVNQKLAAKEQQLMMEEDKLINSFISENFDNCLGPFVFQLATESYEYPVLAPWIEALMSKATDNFKNSTYVKEYMEAAKHNQDIMTGVADVQPQLPQQPLDNAPTPNEMAQSQE